MEPLGGLRSGWWVPAVLVLAGCGDDRVFGPSRFGEDLPSCDQYMIEVRVGNPFGKDAIPALTNPPMVPADHSEADYLLPTDRVIGLLDGDQALAIPLNIMWYHEIVNMDFQGGHIAVTHCPLTGSTLAFDRSEVGGAELGVTGLLLFNNLIMYDRREPESLWSQMNPVAQCSVLEGTRLSTFPVIETTWAAWQALHPNTVVVSWRTGHPPHYEQYPYGRYREIDNPRLLFRMDVDPRRPAKEPVLGLPESTGGVAFPFQELAKLGRVAVVDVRPPPDGQTRSDRVIFWDADAQAAAAYFRRVAGRELTFRVVGATIVDEQTGSSWSVDGLARSGPLAGTRLFGIPEAYTAYWFGWAAFMPRTEIWRAP